MIGNAVLAANTFLNINNLSQKMQHHEAAKANS
jgi:hypothetical protein